MVHWPFPVSLRFRLILLILGALVPALAILIYNAIEHRAQAADKAQAEVLTLSQLATRQQEQVLESARQVLVTLAGLPEVRGQDAAACIASFTALLPQYEGYTGFAVVEPNGDLFCRTAPLTQTVNVADSPVFQRALTTGQLAVGEYQIGRVSGKPTLSLCYPILDDQAQPQRVICDGVDLNYLNQAAADFQLSPGSSLTIIDRNGTLLVRYPDLEDWLGKNLPDEPLIRAMLAGQETELELTGLDGLHRLYAMTPVRTNEDLDTGLVVAVGVPIGLAYAEVNQQLARDLGLLGLVAGLTLLLAWWGSDVLVLRQVKALVGAAERLSQGDLGARTGLPDDRAEISQLGRSFDAMAAALEQRAAERQQAEEALRLSRDQLAIILQGAADGILALDPAGRMSYANAAAARFMGYPSVEALLAAPPAEIQHMFEIYDETGQPFPREQLPGQRVLQGVPQASATIRYRNRTTGEERWSAHQSTAVFDAEGHVVLAVNLLHDITDLKRAELAQHLLAEVGRLLAGSLDWSTQLSGIARLVVPTLADWCAVDVLDPVEEIRRVVVVHRDPAQIELAHAIQRRYPVKLADRGGVAAVLRTGQSEFQPDLTAAPVAASAHDADHAQLLEGLNLRSVIIAPLIAHGRTLGALTLGWAESGWHYTPADLALAEEIGRRAGLALDHARLYAQMQGLNAELEQRINERTAQLQAANAQLKNEIRERWEALRQLEDSQTRLRLLSAHLQSTREEERIRIARELHDELGQIMTGLKIDVAWVRRALADQDLPLRQRLEDMSQLIDAMIQSIRRIATELRPGILDDFGLVAAIEWQLNEFRARTGIACELTSKLEDESTLDSDRKTALFRIFQETLTNVARHANATAVVVNLEKSEAGLLLQVQDNGHGITPTDIAKSRSFGLLGMRERVNLLNGEFSLHGTPGQGTTLLVRIPHDPGPPAPTRPSA